VQIHANAKLVPSMRRLLDPGPTAVSVRRGPHGLQVLGALRQRDQGPRPDEETHRGRPRALALAIGNLEPRGERCPWLTSRRMMS
jgi:hypothetical protein